MFQVKDFVKKVDFDMLLEQATEDNLHNLVDYGVPRGKEVW